ncbi:hypothetical protein V5096_19285 [Pseudoalteromonas carrageenovora]|uniref:hypothetical protein n=1 Tax=Pseudoalteromonas carrageenovora TaxID=227 RepID=UPI002FD24EC4
MRINCILCGSNSYVPDRKIKKLIEKYLSAKFNVNSIANHISNDKSCLKDLQYLFNILQESQTNLPASVSNSELIDLEETFRKLKITQNDFDSHKAPIRNVNALFRSFRKNYPNHQWCTCLIDLNNQDKVNKFNGVLNQLQTIANGVTERLFCVNEITVNGSLNKSNPEISVHVFLSNEKVIKKRIVGSEAITDSKSYIESITDDGLVNDFNISSLNSDAKIEALEEEILTFIKNNFYDSETVTGVKLVTAKDIHPNDRAKIHSKFEGSERYVCLISLIGERLIRTTFRHLRSRVEKSCGKWLHYMGEKHYFTDKAIIYTLTTSPLLSNITSIDVQKISKGKKTKKVTIKYEKDSAVIELEYGDYMFRRMQDFYYFCIHKSSLDVKVKKQSVIFYAWVARTRTKVSAKKATTICKFGLTYTNASKNSLDNERNIELVKGLIEKRRKDYIRAHKHSFNFENNSFNIILYSIGDCQDNSFQALKDFEVNLKRTQTYSENDKIKLQPSGASNISAKELLYSENANTKTEDFALFINARYKNYFNNTEAPDLISIRTKGVKS